MVVEQEGKVVDYIVGCRQTETSGRILSVGVLKKYQVKELEANLSVSCARFLPQMGLNPQALK